MCGSGHWWICSCVGVVIGGYAYVQRWSIVDMLMWSGGQWRDMLMYSSCQLSMMDTLMCTGGQ